MDAYGNLTTQDEFSDGHRIRLVSYLDPDISLGLHASRPGQQNARDLMAYSVGVGWSDYEDTTTLLASSAGRPVVEGQEQFFNLSWADDPWLQDHPDSPKSSLKWMDGQFEMTNAAHYDGTAETGFCVDFVEGCWFALNNVFRNRVVDIRESRRDRNTPIISFPWNGGHNQIWRAQKIG